jgi:adenosylcobinamide kinase/adenosylcobinamide-phosphate guanylyltransferase
MSAETRGYFWLVLGGARSGKSTWAQRHALTHAGRQVLFVATALSNDHEMETRIARHRQDRAALGWRTYEVATGSLADAVTAAPLNDIRLILLDCATLWISRLLREGPDSESDEAAEQRLMAEAEAFLSAWRAMGRDLIVVSNEVGWSVVPDTPLGRRFRDIQGRLNQRLAAAADEVVLLVAGLPLWLKHPQPRKETP